MGSIHQIGNEYFIKFYARGLLYRQKAGTDLAKAHALLRSIEEKIARGEALALVRDIDLDIFFAEFLEHVPRQYHPATILRLKTTIDSFSDFIRSHFPEVTLLSKVTPGLLDDYKDYLIKTRQESPKGLNPKIINLTILLLREIFEEGIKTGFIKDNPTMHVRLLEVESSEVSRMTDDHLAELLKVTHASYQNMFLFMRYTGLRPTELLDLKWDCVDFNRQIIFVRSRELHVAPPAKAILGKLYGLVIDYKAPVFLGPAGVTVHLAELKESFDNARTVAQLSSGYSLMSLRHAFIIDLLSKKVSLLTIGKITGVADIAKLMRFSSYIPGEAPEAVS